MKVRITDCLEPFVWIWGFALVAEWLLTHPKRRNAFRWFWRVLPLSSIPPVHCRIKRVIKERTKVESATFSSERIQRHRCPCEMTRRRMKSSLLACRWSAAVPFPKYNSLHYYSNLLDVFYSIFRLLFFFGPLQSASVPSAEQTALSRFPSCAPPTSSTISKSQTSLGQLFQVFLLALRFNRVAASFFLRRYVVGGRVRITCFSTGRKFTIGAARKNNITYNCPCVGGDRVELGGRRWGQE